MNKIYAVLGMLFLIVLAGCITAPLVKETRSVSTAFTKKAEVESLMFYTADEKGLEKPYRIYNSTFRLNAIDMIWYDLIVKNLSEKDEKIIYREVWLKGDNSVVSSTVKEMNLRSADKYLEYSAGIKIEWVPGYYVLKLYQDSLQIAGREFKIVN